VRYDNGLQVREWGTMIITLALRGALLAAMWWVLAEGRLDGWWLGLIAVVLAVATSIIMLPPRQDAAVPMAALLGFFWYFVHQSARGGIQVAAMALRPRLDLRPAVIELRLDLPSGLARVFMTSVLGLMPGTVSIRLEEHRLRIHVLDERLPVVAEAQALEARIIRLFEGPR
jgi:multicomponent Na+:H+ antiporter subunit E